MLPELGGGADRCPSLEMLLVIAALACVDGALALLAFSQVVRIHLRDQEAGWTRQKVLHLMIGSSNLGYFMFFVLTVVASCERWFCWSHMCGFIFMAYPSILFLAAFLLLLSFWVDFCHQAKDEGDGDDNEGNNMQQALLANSVIRQDWSDEGNGCKCWSFRSIEVEGRQKFVAVVIMLVFVLMIAFAVIIWIGNGNNPIDSLSIAEVYTQLIAVAFLLLGGAIVCYGIALFLKLREVRSESASGDMWKVAGLAAVCVMSFTSSASVALSTETPLFYSLPLWDVKGVKPSLLLIVYLFIGSSVPSAFLLWVMRELPRPITSNTEGDHATVTFISYGATVARPSNQWAAATSSRNQVAC
ncbi:tobamovirus multiplication protein 1 isoform X2 [Rhodamnia argentea]|uniref:Tobamovirus multiplication protein 1 isoform X2 n=1 Tax=Rhodamnia argentea TaxID=178133 RepID=A0A8B8NAI5_9MYRT|nr:tobamovirus multiplication protein 1 isoform X2 [Rhodamnia argentea]